MDIKTIILLTAGILTIGTMIYCIMRTSEPKATPKNTDMVIVSDDQSESNYETIEDQGDESVYES